MAFVVPVEIPLAEVSIDDEQTILKRFGRVMDCSLPGFLIRHSCPGSTDDHAAAIAGILRREFTLTNRWGIVFHYDTPEDPDQGLHIDVNSYRARAVNLYGIAAGEVDVDLLGVQPVHLDRLIAEQCGLDEIEVRQGSAGRPTIDDSLLVPEVHTVRGLRSGRTLVFSDNTNVHDFRTTEWPRESHATIFSMVIPNQDLSRSS